MDVEVAASAQLSKERASRGGEGRLRTPRKGRELYSDRCTPPRRFPFRALARLRPLRPVPPPERSRLLPLPLPLFLLRAPRPRQPGTPPPPPPALGRRRGKPRGPRGTESRDENVLGEKAKSCAQLGERERKKRKEKFGVAACLEPAKTPACGEGFLPLPRVWAARGPGARDGRGLPPPRAPAGEDRPQRRTTLGRPEAPCPGDAETRAAGSARTRLQPKDVSWMQAKHTPRPREGEEGDLNRLSNVRFGPKTSPPCADLSWLEQTFRLSDVGGRHRFQA